MKIKKILICLSILLFGFDSIAANVLFKNLNGTNLWKDNANWENGVPSTGKYPIVVTTDSDRCIIDSNTNALTDWDLYAGHSSYDVSGEIQMIGGTLVAPKLTLGTGSNTTGVFDLSNGFVNISTQTKVGWRNGNGTLEISGGTFSTDSLTVPTNEATYANTTGTVYLSGGTLEIRGVSDSSISVFDELGGKVIITGTGTLKYKGTGQQEAYDRLYYLSETIGVITKEPGKSFEIDYNSSDGYTYMTVSGESTSPATYLAGDLNKDTYVNFSDLEIMLNDWLTDSNIADINQNDNLVNLFDFALLAKNWQKFYDPNYPTGFVVWPEDFGAVGDGVTDDTDAFYAASQAIEANGGGTLYLHAGKTYRVGRQYHVYGQYPYWQAAPIILFENVSGKITVLGNGATLKANSGLKYGSFHPITGEPYFHDNITGFTDLNYRTGAYKGMIDILNCSDIEIRNINLDGNISSLELGGYWSDSYQCYAHGIHLIDVDNGKIYDVNSSYHAFDGLYVRHRYINEYSNPTPVYIENSVFNYNGRQGLSWCGGIGLTAVNCKFNHTGKAPGGFHSPPAAGVDIEPLSTELCLDGNFIDCDFVDNQGCGLVANNPEGRYVKDMEFNNCLFWGTTNWSVWPFQKQFVFNDCRIYGTLVNVYFSESQPELSGKFFRCHFEDYTGYYEGQLYDSHRGNGGLLQFHGDNIIIEDSNIVANSIRAFYMGYDDQEIIRECTVTHKYVYGGSSQSAITGAYIENTQFKEDLPAGTNYFIDVNNVTVGPGVVVDGPQCKWDTTTGLTGTIPQGTY